MTVSRHGARRVTFPISGWNSICKQSDRLGRNGYETKRREDGLRDRESALSPREASLDVRRREAKSAEESVATRRRELQDSQKRLALDAHMLEKREAKASALRDILTADEAGMASKTQSADSRATIVNLRAQAIKQKAAKSPAAAAAAASILPGHVP